VATSGRYTNSTEQNTRLSLTVAAAADPAKVVGGSSPVGVL